jgi:glucose-1-phosphate thymidylyltransferase
MAASEFVCQIEKRQGQKICCPEEICLLREWITNDQLEALLKKQQGSEYNRYLYDLITERRSVAIESQ